MQSYWEQSSGNLKWMKIGLGNLGDYAVNIKRGYEAATFTDDDFIIEGCNPTQTNQVYASDNSDVESAQELEKIAEEARESAYEAKWAAKTAKKAAKRASTAAIKAEKALKSRN